MKQTAFNKIELEDAGLIYKRPEPPKNVFIFSASFFDEADYLEKTRQIIKSQIEQGVVVLSSCVTLEAVTGPCTDVEVIIKQEERT